MALVSVMLGICTFLKFRIFCMDGVEHHPSLCLFIIANALFTCQNKCDVFEVLRSISILTSLKTYYKMYHIFPTYSWNGHRRRKHCKLLNILYFG